MILKGNFIWAPELDRLEVREHAYLVPWGKRLPFRVKGPVFKLK